MTQTKNQNQANKYSNLEAYQQLQKLMELKKHLTVKFYTSPMDKTPCAWVETRHTGGFRYILKNESLQGLLRYLCEGRVEDFDTNPDEYEALPENAPDYGVTIMKELIRVEQTIQWVPLFRDRSDKISGHIPYMMGRIYIRIPRTEDNLDYLRENKQLI